LNAETEKERMLIKIILNGKAHLVTSREQGMKMLDAALTLQEICKPNNQSSGQAVQGRAHPQHDKIVALIEEGKSTKEICKQLNARKGSVEKVRTQINQEDECTENSPKSPSNHQESSKTSDTSDASVSTTSEQRRNFLGFGRGS
jgi:hypothetical protein